MELAKKSAAVPRGRVESTAPSPFTNLYSCRFHAFSLIFVVKRRGLNLHISEGFTKFFGAL